MFKPLDVLLHHLVRCGSLIFTDADGIAHRYGDGRDPLVALKVADKRTERHLVVDPELALGEGYMEGRIVMQQGRIYDLLELLLSNARSHPLPGWTQGVTTGRYLIRRVKQFNPARRARRNVAHHYDINGAIYDLFLDSDRQYSCGYFTEGADLEEAQRAKKRHIAAKLAIEPGQRVLDIGSGWGGAGRLPRQACELRRDGRDALHRAAQALQRARRPRGPRPHRALPVQGLPQGRGPVRPHRLGGHVRARRRQPLRRLLPQACAICSPTTAWR